jgi:hypothetical protein
MCRIDNHAHSASWHTYNWYVEAHNDLCYGGQLGIMDLHHTRTLRSEEESLSGYRRNNFLTALPFFCKLRHLPDTIKKGWCDHTTSLSVEKMLNY